MPRAAEIERNTQETSVRVKIRFDESGEARVSTGIPFFDHMLGLFAVHGFLNLSISATGDTNVDYHHTVEDVGLVLGDALREALGNRRGIRRYGYAVTPMDEALAEVAVDLSNRPYLVYRLPEPVQSGVEFDRILAKEFFRAFCTRAGITLHIHVPYGENEHHLLEAVFKSLGRALDQAAQLDSRIKSPLSTKGIL